MCAAYFLNTYLWIYVKTQRLYLIQSKLSLKLCITSHVILLSKIFVIIAMTRLSHTSLSSIILGTNTWSVHWPTSIRATIEPISLYFFQQLLILSFWFWIIRWDNVFIYGNKSFKLKLQKIMIFLTKIHNKTNSRCGFYPLVKLDQNAILNKLISTRSLWLGPFGWFFLKLIFT
jgi:hypothetical protein